MVILHTIPCMKKHPLPFVSVLVPAFNEEKYIRKTILSLLAQDYPSFEIIVIDNASTDHTASLVRQLIAEKQAMTADIRLQLLTEPRKGTNFARECGRRFATGSIIAQVDADCLPESNWLRKGVRALCHFKKHVAVTGPYDYFDGDYWLRIFSLLSQKLTYPLVNHMVQLSRKGAILIGGNAFVRADVLEAAGGYNTALTFYGDDVDLGKRLARLGYVAYIPSLVQQSSSRRYKANGFWNVNKQYQRCFWDLMKGKDVLLRTAETNHPR